MNIVGTHWLWVTRCRSIALSASSGSNRDIITTVPPSWWTACRNAKGPA
jgi:hypothetical protein